MKCNGCGAGGIELGATFSYDGYEKTLCPKCARVMKSILLNSDLSEHWEKEVAGERASGSPNRDDRPGRESHD